MLVIGHRGYQRNKMGNEEIFKIMRDYLSDAPVTIPPQSFLDMNIEVISYEDGQSIEISAPLYEKYNNPAGMILGGYLPTFFDLAFGPLSFLVTKRPTTSLDLNTTFIKPISVRDEQIIIKAKVINQSRSYLYLEAKAFNPKQELIAAAISRMRILG